jgi:serine/threonine protein kinase
MLQKNPEDRPTAHQALAHKWIHKYMSETEKNDILFLEKETKGELNGVQENMKRFQEE